MDVASLAAFRILFGLLMAAAMVRFVVKGWVEQLYVQPSYFFSYPGFGWVQPWPGGYMKAHFIALAICALGVALGWCYRWSAALFFVGFTYVELLDQTAYLNHYYLISLLSGLLVFLPAQRCWSVDAWRKPEVRAAVVPGWSLDLLRFQVAIVYIFAGLVKFNVDWLWRAEPLRIWLAARSDLPWIGPWLSAPWIAYAASWFGAAFDTSIVFLLCSSKTRRLAYALVIFFHVATWILFNIGMFPWIMIATATVLLPPDWPRRAWARLSLSIPARASRAPAPENLLLTAGLHPRDARVRRWLPLVLGLYAAVQLALPTRSYFYTQPPAWTGDGFNCAWRVMIAEKSGYTELFACDVQTGRRWKLPLNDLLTPRQEMLMAQDPYLVRELARHLAAELRIRRPLQIQAESFASLNGRPSQRLINPEVNLAGNTPPGWIRNVEK